MKFFESIKQRQENKKTLREMIKLAEEFKSKKKILKSIKDEVEAKKIKKDLAEIRKKIIELNNAYVYRYRSIDKQKKNEIKKCKKELEDFYLHKEFMEKSLRKYENEKSEFSKEKYNRLKKKYDRLLVNILKLERRIEIAQGKTHKNKAETVLSGNEPIDTDNEKILNGNEPIDTDNEKILNGLFKSKTKIEEEIRLKKLNIEKIKDKASSRLLCSLEKDLVFLEKKLKDIKDNISFMNGDEKDGKEDKA